MSTIRTVEKQNIINDRYEPYGFFQNPFPRKPGISITSSDKRENGSIYIPDLRQQETKDFERIVIPSKGKHETKDISFLMDYATRQGRGIGKTSFLNYQKNRINTDLGNALSKGSEVLFAVYCSPIPGERYKNFYSISKLIIQSLIEQKIIAIAMARLRALTGLLHENIFDEVNDENICDTIGNYKWIKEKYNDLKLNDCPSDDELLFAIKRKLMSKFSNSDLSDQLCRWGFSINDIQKYFISKFNENDWKKHANNLLFNDLILLFEEAKFTKGIILFDELEKITMPQNSQERRMFCDELRYFFLDGDNENSRQSFFNVIMVIHPYIQEILNPHWSASGLDRFASLGGEFTANYSVFFKPIESNQAIPLAKAYMKESRLPNFDKESILPFDKDSLEFALEKTGKIPGKYLSFLQNTLEKGIHEGWTVITKDKIEQVSITSSINYNGNDDYESEGELSKPKIIL